MKKTTLAIAMLAIMLGTAACSSTGKDTATTAAPSAEASTEAVTETESQEEEEQGEEEDVEEDSITGEITAIDGDILTVRSDDDDSEKNYDLSKAEITQEFPFAEGDLVDIIFPYETTEDPVPVIALEVLESVIGQNADPSATGKVTEITDTTLTLELEEGESYTLSIANAYIVSKEGIKADSEATVTEDSYDTAEAELSAFIGKVAQNEEDNIVLESAEGDFYTFVSDDIDFSAYSTGDTLQIFYTGTITDKEISADKVEKK